MLYQALTGRTPHTGNSLIAIAAATLTDPIVPPSALNPAVPAGRAGLLRALSRRPADRYPNVARFVEALQAAVQNATKATPPHHAGAAVAQQTERSSIATRHQPASLSTHWMVWPDDGGARPRTCACGRNPPSRLWRKHLRAVGPTARTSESDYERALNPAQLKLRDRHANASAPKPTKTPSATKPSAAPPPLSDERATPRQGQGGMDMSVRVPRRSRTSAPSASRGSGRRSPSARPSLVYGAMRRTAQRDRPRYPPPPGVAPGGADQPSTCG